MRQSLYAYERGDHDLGQLVKDVEGIVDALAEASDRDWVEEFRSTWSRLEIVYAIGLDQGRASLTDAERGDVEKDTHGIQSLLAGRTST